MTDYLDRAENEIAKLYAERTENEAKIKQLARKVRDVAKIADRLAKLNPSAVSWDDIHAIQDALGGKP